jgi:predicted dehydrogenase
MKTARAKIRVAVAGAGMVTRHHLLGWRKQPQVDVVAICARHVENARRRASEFGVPSAYGEVAEMLEREKPDALDIATPPEVHGELVRMAADRGVDVLCQKPMTPSLEESERLVAEVGERVRFMVHENWRFRPQYRQVAVWLAEGKTGPVREFQMTVRSSGLLTRGPSGEVLALERQPFFKTLDRFLVMEVLIHHLDTIRFLVGPVDVTAAALQRVSRDIRGEDVALVSLRSEGGAVGVVAGNFSAAGYPPLPEDRLELVGENGSVVFENGLLRLIGKIEESIPYDFDTMYQRSYDNAIAHFIECLQSGAPFETDRLDNLDTLRLVTGAYRLAGRGESG